MLLPVRGRPCSQTGHSTGGNGASAPSCAAKRKCDIQFREEYQPLPTFLTRSQILYDFEVVDHAGRWVQFDDPAYAASVAGVPRWGARDDWAPRHLAGHRRNYGRYSAGTSQDGRSRQFRVPQPIGAALGEPICAMQEAPQFRQARGGEILESSQGLGAATSECSGARVKSRTLFCQIREHISAHRRWRTTGDYNNA